MPSLDELLTPQQPARPGEREVVQGELVLHAGDRYARVDGDPALMGPLVGGLSVDEGETIALVISQDGTPFVVYPAEGGDGGGGTGPPGPPGGRTYQQTIGDGASRAFVVAHNFGTRSVNVTVYRASSPYDEVEADVEHTSGNTITVRTTTTPAVGELVVLVAAAGDIGTYVYTQTLPSTAWTIVHLLGYRPSVTVVDTGDTVVIPDVHYVSDDELVVSFGSATSGKAYLN